MELCLFCTAFLVNTCGHLHFSVSFSLLKVFYDGSALLLTVHIVSGFVLNEQIVLCQRVFDEHACDYMLT